jgi:hypothetical protein
MRCLYLSTFLSIRKLFEFGFEFAEIFAIFSRLPAIIYVCRRVSTSCIVEYRESKFCISFIAESYNIAELCSKIRQIVDSKDSMLPVLLKWRVSDSSHHTEQGIMIFSGELLLRILKDSHPIKGLLG